MIEGESSLPPLTSEVLRSAELQVDDHVGEDDIERLEDIYGR